MSGPLPSPAVVVVGSVNVDFVVRATRLPSAGETVTGRDFARHHGGKGANQAVAAARLGASVVFIGAVGRDEDGRAALDELRREGVNVGSCVLTDGAATGAALIVVDDAGENQIAVAPGANALLSAREVENALSGLDVAGGAYLANFEVSDEALLAGARWAAQRGMLIVVNPAPARALPPALADLRPILVLNEGEAQALSGADTAEDAAVGLTVWTLAPVVVTLGAAGALVLDGQVLRRVAAPAVTALDATGAGDTFCGALCAEVAARTPLAESVVFAVAAAARSVTAVGARGGMPRRGEVDSLLAGLRAEWDSNPRHEG